MTISSSRQTRDAKRSGRGSGGRGNRKLKKKPPKAKAPRKRQKSNRKRASRSSSRSLSLPRLPLPSFGLIGLVLKLALVCGIGYGVIYGADAAWRAVTTSPEIADLTDKLIKRLLDEDVPRAKEPKPKAKKTAKPSKALPAPKSAPVSGGDAVVKKSTRAELPAGSPEDYAGDAAAKRSKGKAELDSIVDRVVGGR